MSLLGFHVFCESSSIVLNSYFDILVNSTTIRSVLKLPKMRDLAPLREKGETTLEQGHRYALFFPSSRKKVSKKMTPRARVLKGGGEGGNGTNPTSHFVPKTHFSVSRSRLLC